MSPTAPSRHLLRHTEAAGKSGTLRHVAAAWSIGFERLFVDSKRRTLLAFIGVSALNPSPPEIRTRGHLVLLGDSVFDNAAYTGGGPSVSTQLAKQLPDWRTSMVALDGATTQDIPRQVAALPKDATHLVLSVGGNDALRHMDLLDTPVDSSDQAFDMLAEAVSLFERDYGEALRPCLATRLPMVICTIYNGNFPDPVFQRIVTIAASAFNNVILREATVNGLRVIDLRLVCDRPEDYANPIEPSPVGGEKIVRVIARAVEGPPHQEPGAHVLGAA